MICDPDLNTAGVKFWTNIPSSLQETTNNGVFWNAREFGYSSGLSKDQCAVKCVSESDSKIGGSGYPSEHFCCMHSRVEFTSS